VGEGWWVGDGLDGDVEVALGWEKVWRVEVTSSIKFEVASSGIRKLQAGRQKVRRI